MTMTKLLSNCGRSQTSGIVPSVQFLQYYHVFVCTLSGLACYWTPGLSRKGPIKRVCSSFRPSFRLSLSFLGIGSLVFCKTKHAVRSPYIVVCDKAGFCVKNAHRAKMTKSNPKTGFLNFSRKSRH